MPSQPQTGANRSKQTEGRATHVPPVALQVPGGHSQNSLAWQSARAIGPIGPVGVDVVFIYDTVSKLRGASTGLYGMTTDYVLPAKKGDRCTVITRFGKERTARGWIVRVIQTAAARDQILGPCAYYGAFGTPELGPSELVLPYHGLDGVERRTHVRFGIPPTRLDVVNPEPLRVGPQSPRWSAST